MKSTAKGIETDKTNVNPLHSASSPNVTWPTHFALFNVPHDYSKTDLNPSKYHTTATKSYPFYQLF